jgi:cardiolipin synthase A/B
MFPLPAFWSSPAMAMTLAILHVGLAIIVTIDVLLKKSDVRGALGWIGAVWFAPILGSLLYYMFGINRVSRRALKFSRLREKQAQFSVAMDVEASANIKLLSQVSGHVTQTPLTSGNAFKILEGGDEAYPAMLAAIRSAKYCIGMSSYIFRDDAAGQEFAEALIEASRRGVAVRVLLDSVGIGYIHPEIFYRMRREGVEAARFLHTWLPWRMPFLNMRNHRKILVTDGALAFMGGINIGAENSARLSGPRRIRDVHFRVEGPVVREVMDAFASDWSFTTNETLDEHFWWPELKTAGGAFARGLRSGPDADLYRLELILGAALNQAQHHIRIVTPYFLPDQRLQFAIQQAGLRGVKIEIVLPAKSDQLIMQWAMRGHLRFFHNVRAAFITTPPPFDHAKLCTVDGQWSLIGSSNWDARSFRLNFEFDLEVTDRTLTAELDALIDARIATGKTITAEMLGAEPLWKRLRNAAARLLMPYL